MRMMIKKLLKSHKYPPEGMDDAVQIVMTQCEMWVDNSEFDDEIASHDNAAENVVSLANYSASQQYGIAAEKIEKYKA